MRHDKSERNFSSRFGEAQRCCLFCNNREKSVERKRRGKCKLASRLNFLCSDVMSAWNFHPQSATTSLCELSRWTFFPFAPPCEFFSGIVKTPFEKVLSGLMQICWVFIFCYGQKSRKLNSSGCFGLLWRLENENQISSKRRLKSCVKVFVCSSSGDVGKANKMPKRRILELSTRLISISYLWLILCSFYWCWSEAEQDGKLFALICVASVWNKDPGLHN